MKIGVDISQIIYGGGVSIYTQNLFNNILRLNQRDQFTFFFSSLRQSLSMNQKDLFFAKNSKLKQFRFPQTALDFLWNKVHLPPIESLLGPIDVFHSSDWTQPPSKKAKLVTTIHDLSFLKYPNSVDPKVLVVQKRRLDWVKKEVDHIIAVSSATKNEIIKLLKIDPDKITVIHEALPDDIARFKPNQKLLAKTKKELKIKIYI